MDSADQNKLMQGLAEMAARSDLQSDYPEQYDKNWQNEGKSGTVRIFTSRFVDHPAELTLSLFFSGEEVTQTGILIKFRDHALINEVRKGDVFDFQQSRRIDPLAILRQSVATVTGTPTDESYDSVSFTLAIDDDSEAEVFRAVEHLSGMTREELTARWGHLLATNDQRPGLDRVSPIIKTWLKKQRNLLDLQYLRTAHLLEPRAKETSTFTAHGRTFTVIARQMPSREILEHVDHADPEWWGGAFYAIVNGRLSAVPYELRDRFLAMKAFHGGLEFPVEDIYVDHRHVYSVVFPGEKALVWRTKTSDAPPPTAVESAAAPAVKQKAVGRGKWATGMAVAEQPAHSAPADVPAGGVHPFILARTEKLYIDALRGKAPDHNARRQELMNLLFDSERRFANNAEALRAEMAGVAGRAFPHDAAGLARETALLQAHVTIFYAEKDA